MNTLPKRPVVIVVNTAWAALKFRKRLIQSIRETGREVTVLTEPDDSFEKLRLHCNAALPLKAKARSKNIFVDAITLLDLIRRLRTLRPTVVLSFTIKPNIYASIACRMVGIPIINNVTGLGDANRFTGWRLFAIRWLYRIAFKNSHLVFFQNEEDLAALIKDQMVRPEKTKLLPGSGVDIDHFVPLSPIEKKPTPIRFVMAARLLRDKGVKEYAEAAQIVKFEFPEVIFDLWGVLDENDPRYARASQIKSWCDAGVLNFYGEADDAIQSFKHATCVVLPSYYSEGVPRTLLEAASMGIPSITTDTPGCRDAVQHKITGLLCQPRNVESLAAAMREVILQDDAAWLSMSKQARKHAVDNFDERVVLNAYLTELDLLGA